MRKNGWTADDVNKLRECAEKGYSVYRIAAAMRRTVNGVRAKAAKEGLSLQTGKAIRATIQSGPGGPPEIC